MKVLDRLIRWIESPFKKQTLEELQGIDAHLQQLRKRHSRLTKLIRSTTVDNYRHHEFVLELEELEDDGRALRDRRERLASRISAMKVAKGNAAPLLGERILLLILTKEERVNIPGDLEEEFAEVAAKHGDRFARVWYYKQVAASACPLVRKAVRWGLLASIGEWFRRLI